MYHGMLCKGWSLHISSAKQNNAANTLGSGTSMRIDAPFEVKKNTNVYDKGDVSLGKAKHYHSKTTYPRTLNCTQWNFIDDGKNAIVYDIKHHI